MISISRGLIEQFQGFFIVRFLASKKAKFLCVIPFSKSAPSLNPTLPRSTAIVRQSVAVSFLIEMSLVDFECVSKREGREQRFLTQHPLYFLRIHSRARSCAISIWDRVISFSTILIIVLPL